MRTSVAVVLITWLLAAAGAAATPQDVELVATDGAKLKATYFPAAAPGPAVILLHQCGGEGGNRKAWRSLAERLAGEGIHVLTLDFRGFGESGFSTGAAKPDDNEQKQWPGDVEAALGHLTSRPGVDASSVGAAGASCGCQQAVTLARRRAEVRALVLLSGGTDEAGRRFLAGPAAVPVLAAGSRDDYDFVAYLAWLIGFSSSPDSAMLAFEKAGHGTDMFAVERELEPRIVAHFARHLRRRADAAAPPRREPEASPAHEFWAALTSAGGTGRALAMLEAARRADPSAVLFPEMAIQQYAWGREEDGEPNEAIEILKVALAAYPRSAWVHSSLARACEKAGARDEAIRWAEKGLEIIAEGGGEKTERDAHLAKRLRERLARLKGATP